jgi:hypothetical protein
MKMCSASEQFHLSCQSHAHTFTRVYRQMWLNTDCGYDKAGNNKHTNQNNEVRTH